MKFKIALTLLIMISGLQLMAEEFKVGNAKFTVLDDTLVKLKEYKKATGDIVIPATVTNKKRDYKVVSIGDYAFYKTDVSSVVIPESVQEMGIAVFSDCKNLKRVDFKCDIEALPASTFANCSSLDPEFVSELLKKVKYIGPTVFLQSPITSLVIPQNIMGIDEGAFRYCVNLKTVSIEPSTTPNTLITIPNGKDSCSLAVVGNIFEHTNLQTLRIDRSIYGSGNFLGDAQVSNIIIGNNVELPAEYYILKRELPASVLAYANPDFNKYVELTGEGVAGLPDFYYNGKKIPGLTLKYYMIKCREIVEHSENQDKANGTAFQGMLIHDAIDIIWMCPDAFHSVLDRAADAVIEDWKDPISNDNINHIQALANNYIQMICLENGEEFGSITKWADLDLLRKAANDSTAQQDYEIILALAEKILKNKPREIYTAALQLVGLCGIGRYQEAAAYFPKAHRLITENGKYVVPKEIEYIRQFLVDKGYKVKAPVYASSKSKKSTAGKKEYQSSELMEFFFEKGYQKYKEHRDKRRFKKWLRKTGRI